MVAQQLAELMDLGLVVEGEVMAVARGRSPRELQFNRNLGFILCADIGVSGIFIGLANLAGEILESDYVNHEVTDVPCQTLSVVEEAFDKIRQTQAGSGIALWAIGIGIPAPVEFETGRPVSPPLLPDWNGNDIRSRFQDRYNVPVWVDNVANLMALGELRVGAAVGQRDVIVVRISGEIGSGLISNGTLHRGDQGSAGKISHVKVSENQDLVCKCGKVGCLETVASGRAITREAKKFASEGTSEFLAKAAADHELTHADVVFGGLSGDRSCLFLMNESARLVGETLAPLINFFNPALVLLGGDLMLVGDSYLATVRNIIYSQALPLATRNLVVSRVALEERAGLHGAAFLAIDEIFAPHYFATWTQGKRLPTCIPAETNLGS